MQQVSVIRVHLEKTYYEKSGFCGGVSVSDFKLQ
jgi:hypothetical protein